MRAVNLDVVSSIIRSNSLLKFYGIWPYQSKRSKMIVRPLIYLAILSLMVPQFIRSVYEMRKQDRNITIVTEGFAGIAFFSFMLSRYTNYIIFEFKLKFLYDEIGQYFKNIQIKEEKRVIRKSIDLGEKINTGFTAVYGVGAIFVLSINTTLPLLLDVVFPLNESRPLGLCIYAEYFIDQEKYFNYFLLQTFVSGFLNAFLTITMDTAYIACVFYILGLFHVVDYRLESSYELFNIYKSEGRNKEFFTFMVYTVKIHKRGIEFAELLSRTYEKCFFVSSILAVVGLGIGTVALVYSIHDYSNLLRLILMFLAAMVHIFYINWAGQMMLNISSHLYRSIFCTAWYEYPTNVKFVLYFMMMRCAKPCKLSAGPILTLDLETFTKIMNCAMSYFTVAVNVT